MLTTARFTTVLLALLLARPEVASGGPPPSADLRREVKAVGFRVQEGPDGLTAAWARPMWGPPPLRRQACNLLTAHPVLEKVEGLAALDLERCQIHDLRSIERLRDLRHVGIWWDRSIDLAPLGRLPKLRSVTISSREIRDLRGLARARRLEKLVASPLELDDWSQLSALRNLRHLTFSNAKLDKLNVLAPLRKLEYLEVFARNVRDISGLAKLTELRELRLKVKSTASLAPLARMKRLRRITLRGMSGSYLGDLADHPGIERLEVTERGCMGWGQLTNVEQLSVGSEVGVRRSAEGVTAVAPPSAEALVELAYLAEQATVWLVPPRRRAPWSVDLLSRAKKLVAPLEDLTAADLSGLERAEELDLSLSGVMDLAPLADIEGLHTLHLGWTKVVDLRPVARMRWLRRLHLHGTAVQDLRPLRGMRLQVLDLRGTPVRDVKVLHQMKTLRHVDLRRTEVPKAGLAALRKALPKARILGPKTGRPEWNR